MTYKQILPLHNLNFQMNRVLTHGEEACREEELLEIAPKLQEFDPIAWFEQWNMLAQRAESDGRLMHAAYYHRMSEFFLSNGLHEKDEAYENFSRCFYAATEGENLELFDIPYLGYELPAIRLKAEEEKGVVLLHGGFDSFIEEFYLYLREYPAAGYTVIIFEGPGQGRPLRDGLKMTHEWEKPVAAVIDYFEMNNVTLIGVSLGGYLALRAAAYEPRIQRVVAWDIIWDALQGFNRDKPESFIQLILNGERDTVNALAAQARQQNDMVDWMLTHGMHVTGTETPFDHLYEFTKYQTRDLSPLINQDVLLLAGENDHFVPVEFFELQKAALTSARSVRGRIFTAEEGGDQHCQVGRIDLATDEILDWLDSLNKIEERRGASNQAV
ncbi:MAG: alpha/beta hydrolase [Gammaproteobacteria bacterium]|nr:alpha/beta hydrolase [Gammaproteobacteria bacterium]